MAKAGSTSETSRSETTSEWIAPRELESLIEVMERHDVAELDVVRGAGEGRRRLTIRRGRLAPPVAHVAAPMSAPQHAAPAAAAPPPKAAESSDEGFAFVTSPLVGTFYRAPSPDAQSFVEVGTKIRPGQRLCIVEAMKLMNEIESELEGTIVEILVENGKPVEYGQKLFKVTK
jgi:acetyl-CoA carboxylase biotin carboxyl carrier protein